MKKLVSILLVLVLCFAVFSFGSAENLARVGALKGPTAMGMVQMMGERAEDFDFTIYAAIDEITPLLVKGELDIAAVPANLASVLYNNTAGQVQALAINTLGVLYLVQNGEVTIQSAADLKGKTIFASGKGATPEYALNYLLKGNGLDPEKDVTVEWKSEHSECLAALTTIEGAVAMLPQPFVTTAQMKNPDVHVALDMTEEWNKLQENAETKSTMMTGVVVARAAFVQEHADVVNTFMDAYAASVTFVNENNDEAAALIAGYDIVPEAVAKAALPYCKIVFVEGEKLKEQLSGYLAVLFEQNPKAVGGALPLDDFYYVR